MTVKERRFEFFRYMTFFEIGTVKLTALSSWKLLGPAFGDFDSFKEKFNELEKGLQKDLRPVLKWGKKALKKLRKDSSFKVLDFQDKERCMQTYENSKKCVLNSFEVLDINYAKDQDYYDKLYKKSLSTKTLELIEKGLELAFELAEEQ